MADRLKETAHFWALQLDESDKTVRRALDGVMPDGHRSKNQPTYYLATVWAAMNGLSDELDANRERARKDKETADKLALQNAETRSDVARVSVIERELGMLFADHRSNALGLPSKLAPRMVGLNADQIREIVEGAVYELLGGLADYRPSHGTASREGSDQGSGEGSEATTAIHGQPVGGRRTPAESRKQRGARPVAN